MVANGMDFVHTPDMPQLDQFQLDALSFLDHAGGRAVLADPMGARKTGTTLSWLERTEQVMRTLVVAPASVHGHWAREAARFAPTFDVFVGRGTRAQRHAAFDGAANAFPSLYITTYESLKEDQHRIVEAGFETVVFDEGHRLKGRRTQVALCANGVVKRATRIIIVTGTPVLNHAAELWQYLHMLAPRVYPAFWSWAEENYRIEIKNFRGNRFPTRIIHDFLPGREEVVRNQIAPFFLQRDIADLFPSTPWIEEPDHVEVEVVLSPAERKAYASLVKHKWAMVDGEEITTKNSLDLTTRLTQLTSDWGVFGAETAGTKTKATVELVLDLLERDEQVVVFCKYKATVKAIQDKLVSKHVTALAYHGDIDPHDRDVAVTAFGNGKCSVLIGTLDSLSEGVDGLQHAGRTVVMVDRHWTPAKNDQAIGRLRRSGQTRQVQVFHVFAKDTIDATVTAACLRKTNVIELLRGRPPTDAIYGRV